MNKKFSEKESYTGKWCLYKEHEYTQYGSIFVIASSGGIVKYVTEHNQNSVIYGDCDDFKNYYSFFINPIQGGLPEILKKNDCESSSILCKKGNIPIYPKNTVLDKQKGCNHEWFYFDYMSYPPIHSRECKKCGKCEHLPHSPKGEEAEWIDGAF